MIDGKLHGRIMPKNGISHAVMVASPADLEHFALGSSVSEGIADDKTDIAEIAAVAVGAGIKVRIALMAKPLAEAHNLTLIALARHDSAVLVSHPKRVY